jgi:hypothetical protein
VVDGDAAGVQTGDDVDSPHLLLKGLFEFLLHLRSVIVLTLLMSMVINCLIANGPDKCALEPKLLVVPAK